ncbi:MAG: hypothetical protein EBQ61_00150 [Micrococcales bacterium]|nr:hypothetical protein [Micrococcales bacterium]
MRVLVFGWVAFATAREGKSMKRAFIVFIAIAGLVLSVSPASGLSKCTSSQRSSINSRQSSVNSAQQSLNTANADLMRANQTVNSAQQKVNSNDSQLADFNRRLAVAQDGANRNQNFPSIQRGYLQTITDINRQISSRSSFWRMDQQTLSNALKSQGSAQSRVASAQSAYNFQVSALNSLTRQCSLY